VRELLEADQDIGVRRQGFVALIPQSIETLQEFRISTLLWDAELGRNPGSQVNAVSRGGSNDFTVSFTASLLIRA